MKKKLEELKKLTQIAREAELAKLNELSRQDEELQSKLRELKAEDIGFVLLGGATDRLSVAHEIRAHTVSAWKARQIAEINRDRSKVRAKIETQKKKASRAFGRDEALSASIKKLKF